MSRFVESKQGGLPATLSAAGVDVEAFPVGFVDERRKGDNLELKVRWKGWGSKDDTWELRTTLTEDSGEEIFSSFEKKMRTEKEKKAVKTVARKEEAMQDDYRKTYTGRKRSKDRL